MTPTAERIYRTREFATLAGVTVRALHHYDHLGLLTPRRSATDYGFTPSRTSRRSNGSSC